jgi:hypothetical protein
MEMSYVFSPGLCNGRNPNVANALIRAELHKPAPL